MRIVGLWLARRESLGDEAMQVTYVDEQPVAEITPNCVRVTVRSGDEVCVRIMPRSLWRRFLETSIRQLNAYEVAERAERKVVKMVKSRHR
jgi:hypothetical protein